ncbi:MAG TPA: hypothetical protein PLH23_05085 [Hyphomonadaceae bacterium]|nr:hypothetical protein [Hyphomonadaceae bacterium]HPI47621.1 hypothetical protein [Hyphomonadaceae bacterium]
MNMQASLLCRGAVIARTIIMMVESFVVIFIVVKMVIMIDRILRHGVDRVTSSIVMLMSVHRGSRDEAVACKGKRQAKAHEASEERHVFRLEANCCRLLNSNFYTRKAPAGIAFAQQTQHFTPSCGVPFG